MKTEQGLTLIELLIAIAIFSILSAAITKIYISQRRLHKNQIITVEIQQNARTSLFMLEKEIRMAGHNPSENVTGTDGMDNDLDGVADEIDENDQVNDGFDNDCLNAADDNNEWIGIKVATPDTIRFTMDISGGEVDGQDNDNDSITNEADEAAFGDGFITYPWNNCAANCAAAGDPCYPNEDITFGFAAADDANFDGIADAGAAPLRRIDNYDVLRGNPADDFQIIANDIHAIGFAYAFDNDMDGWMDFNDLNGNTIHDTNEPILWAVDSDGDGILDISLDTDGDGDIDINDTAGGVALNTTSIATNVNIYRIRAVRVWLLARSGNQTTGAVDNNTYVLGLARVTPNDRFQRRLVTTTIHCRNQGL